MRNYEFLLFAHIVDALGGQKPSRSSPDDSYLGEFSRILANSSLKALANEIEQNRFLTLGAGLILVSNGVYIRNCEITNLGLLLTLLMPWWAETISVVPDDFL